MASYRKVLFLDTCSFHYMRLYYDFAKRHKLQPVGNRRIDPIKVIKKEFENKRTASNLESGCKILNHLKTESQKDGDIQFATLTRIEMTCGMLRGKATIKMAKSLAPRIFSRTEEKEILGVLTPPDYESTYKSPSTILISLNKLGIDISEVDAEKSKEAYVIAAELLRYLYIDVVDLMIYSYALVVQAEELITNDSYFRNVIDGIGGYGTLPADFPSKQFQSVKTALQKKMSELIGTSVSNIKYPKATKF